VLNELERRCVDISFVNGLTHLSSVLTSVNVIDAIYASKRPDDIFVLGNSHAALALFVVLEKYSGTDAEKLVKKHGTHANRDIADGIFVSGGSLGQPEPVSVGMALADRSRDVYLLTSDGALAEGSIWEALRIAGECNLDNFRVDVVANGLGAYGSIDVNILEARLKEFYPVTIHRLGMDAYPAWMSGLDAHYLRLTEAQYEELVYGDHNASTISPDS
jgi:transketolase N-terminal domain/subunit